MGGKREACDQLIARLAAKQHGVVAIWQLLRLKVSRREIERRAESGRLHQLHRGVYAVGHPSVSRTGEFMAAVLAYGPHAVLSHWSAAELWGLVTTRRSLIAISAPTHHRPIPGVKPHWVADFPKSETTRRQSIPVTTVPRTLLDLASSAPFKQLRRATNEAERGGWLSERAVTKMFQAHRRRKGMKAFRAVIAGLDPQARRSRSDLELDFLAFCRHHGLPTPVLNGEIDGYEVDFHWPGTKLIVELDTWDYHGTPVTFEADRIRDADLAAKGYTVIRITGARLRADPAGIAATIRRLLQAG